MIVSVENSAKFTGGARRRFYPVPLTILGVIAAVVLAFALRADHPKQTRAIVERVASPDASVVAVVYELSGDAKSSFVYQVAVVSDGQTQDVAELPGAMRNDRSFGVNLVWSGNDALSIEYLNAQNPTVKANNLNISGHHVQVTMHSGVRDNQAPAGGMLFNLQQSHEPGV
jgi:hypothetical protein